MLVHDIPPVFTWSAVAKTAGGGRLWTVPHAKPIPRSWTVAELEQLGKVPDSVLARRFHCAIKEVVMERERRGIALPTGPRRWTARELLLLGKMNDHELARRLRRPKHYAQRQRIQLKIPPFKPRARFRAWKPSEFLILGTMTDAEAGENEVNAAPTSRSDQPCLHQSQTRA